MVYLKINFNEEINELKKYTVCTWSGQRQKYLIVTIENQYGDKINRKYYFTDRKEYSHFISQLRKLEA